MHSIKKTAAIHTHTQKKQQQLKGRLKNIGAGGIKLYEAKLPPDKKHNKTYGFQYFNAFHYYNDLSLLKFGWQVAIPSNYC